MKKQLVIALALAMALSLCACGGSGSGSGTESGGKTVSASEQESEKKEDADVKESEEPEETISEESADDTRDAITDTAADVATNTIADIAADAATDAAGEKKTTVFSNPFGKKIDFESTVLVDNDECTITIKNIDPNGESGFTLKVLLENKSSDKTYEFVVDRAYVNGLYADPFFMTNVAPGKKANESISFEDTSDTSLEKAGITDFTDIELHFRVSDEDNWEADPVVDDSFHIYPYGEDKVEKYERAPKDTDTVLIDDDYSTVIVTGYSADSYGDYHVELYLVNKTDKKILFRVDDASINGFMVDQFFMLDLGANNCAYSDVTWYKKDLKENDIDINSIEEIELPFKVCEFDEDYWEGDVYSEDVFTLKP